MADKTNHLGMAGHYASMSEFLLRGYNVATPVVDIGDDIYVVDDGNGLLRRVQVKTADGAAVDEAIAGLRRAPELQFKVKRLQLTIVKDTPLYFMFLTHIGGRWRFLLMSQAHLLEVRRLFERSSRTSKETGDELNLKATFQGDCFVFWGQQLPANQWPADLPPLTSGPGARSPAPSRPAP